MAKVIKSQNYVLKEWSYEIISNMFILPVIFIISSVLKSVNIFSFIQEIHIYVDVYLIRFLQPFTMVVAICVCVSEMLLALLALRRDYRKLSCVGFFLMLSIFVYLTGINLFFPTMFGRIESCGCFGELIHFTPTASFIKSALLWFVSLALLIACTRNHEPWHIRKLIKDPYTYVCTVFSFVLPLYSLWFFNELSHALYLAGFIILCIVLLTSTCLFLIINSHVQNL